VGVAAGSEELDEVVLVFDIVKVELVLVEVVVEVCLCFSLRQG
jgi:hypothetical protein